MLNLDVPFRNKEIFIVLSFNSSDLGLVNKKGIFGIFWLIFRTLDLDPWIRIFLPIWKPKYCGSNRSGFHALSITVKNPPPVIL